MSKNNFEEGFGLILIIFVIAIVGGILLIGREYGAKSESKKENNIGSIATPSATTKPINIKKSAPGNSSPSNTNPPTLKPESNSYSSPTPYNTYIESPTPTTGTSQPSPTSEPYDPKNPKKDYFMGG